VKQQLLPHEDDQQNHPPQQHQHQHQHQQQQQQQQQHYPFPPAPGYPQQPPLGAQPLQPYGAPRPSYNPYQPYGAQPNYFGPPSGPTPYNALQPWSNLGAVGGPAEQEIHRLRSHIHTLEGELHKLQRKLTKTTLTNTEVSGQGARSQDEDTRSHRRSKRDGPGSPRQTPVIVELNSTTGEAIRESSSRKHRHRTASNVSAQQGQSVAQKDSTSVQQNTTGQGGVSSAGAGLGQNPNQQSADAREP
jgi:hypothetical protein